VREDAEALRDKLNEILAQKQAEIDALLLPEAMMKQEFSLMLGVVSAVSLVVALGVGQQAAAQSSGKQAYDQACARCHTIGMLGAPKLGDSSAWKARIKKGKQVLYQSAINGIGTMPPKGGSTLSDSQVKAAVDYMISQASGGGH
jgi:cytochrome c5